MDLFFTGIILLIAGGVCSLFLPEKLKLKLLSAVSFLSLILFLIPSFNVLLFSPDAAEYNLTWNGLIKNVPFVIDSLSAIFIIIISVVSFLCTVYANGYMQPYFEKGRKTASHCFFLPLLTAAMLLVVTVQNALFFLIVWELMSIASFFLVIFEDDKKEVLSAGIKYLIYMHISVIFIIALFVLMTIKSGSYNFNSFTDIFIQNPYLKDVAFILAFLGFGTKAGFVPMHNWLPDAHPAAPSHVSAIMSAVMIKTGIYGLLRILIFINKPTAVIAYFMLCVSVITALYGISYAVTQKDIKKTLAYSSVENIGIIGVGISVGLLGLLFDNSIVTMLGFSGAVLHVLNHSIFKSLMFMGAGSVYLKTHTKNMELLGGLIKSMPKTAICTLFGCVAISALPPLNGFIGEFLIYSGLLSALNLDASGLFIIIMLSLAALALVGTLAILCFTKVFSVVFLGLPRSEASEKVTSDVGKYMLIPMIILSALTLIIGCLAPFMIMPVGFIFTDFIGVDEFLYGYFVTTGLFAEIFVCVSAFVIIMLTILIVRKIFCPKRQEYTTWGCGYDKGNNHIQYTASSYVNPIVSILTPMFRKIFDVKKPKGLFPGEAHFNSTIEDVEEAYIINPVLKFDEKFLSKFERLQDGNIQHYILYGLVFLILALIGVIFIG